MFIYLNKKIAIPKDVRLRCLCWNAEQGWIACGGDNGLLKVVLLENTKDKAKGVTAPSKLDMNQTLEGHTGAVMCVTWNEQYRKLTSSDENGLIIVWMLYKKSWYEEMINNRKISVVKDMKWTADGQKICIVYEDGAVIVGSVDGNRIWGKELQGVRLRIVEWSPDGRHILFGTVDSEVHVYDNMGNAITKVPIFISDKAAGTEIIGVDWYDGNQGYADANAPVLVIAFNTGKMQLMKNEQDQRPVIVDCGMKTSKVKWNRQGTVLAVAGVIQVSGKDENLVQFFDCFGKHLRSLKVPGSSISGMSWEGSGLRIAMAVDSFIYFANIRPDYKWGYFAKTLVYAVTKPERPEHCVVFWDTKTDERYIKYVKKLIAIRAAGDNCVLVTKTDDSSEQYILILCNAIGTPVDSKYTEVEPKVITMTKFHIAIASTDYVYVWQYRTMVNNIDIKGLSSTPILKKEGKEKLFHIDDTHSAENGRMDFKRTNASTYDPICCITASDKYLIVGRESGNAHRYNLPEIKLDNKYQLKCKAQYISLNCTSTRMSIIDNNGVLTFMDLDTRVSKSVNPNSRNNVTTPSPGQHLSFERKDVWDMQWSDDNPELFAMMEKTRMYICRGLEVEEPIQSSGYICHFSNLKVKAVLLDEIMKNPEHPDIKEMVLKFETKSLRDARDILANVGIKDAYQFIEDNPHPRLWRIMAESALERLDFNVAEKAFVKCQDFQGIQFVKRLKILDNKNKQRAEVAAYFKRFDEAETIYREMDRKDLAIDLRIRLGDWFRVLQLIQTGGGDDLLKQRAMNMIGDYYAERYKWANAVQYYSQAKNYPRLVECYYILEDYTGLEELIHTLPERDSLLNDIGEKFTSVGISEHAVAAFLKAGNVKSAIDCCVHLNKWDAGVDLAEHHDFQQIETLLSKYANHLLEKKKTLHAIELYRKASHHTEAAKLLFKLGKESGQKGHLIRAKKLCVLGALEVEQYRKKTLEQANKNAGNTKKGTLEGLLMDDSTSGRQRDIEASWRGAEAYHFLIMCQKQLYEGYVDAAMKTACRLVEYEDVLDAKDINSILALTAYFNKYYGVCSRAFMRLENLEDVPQSDRDVFGNLALDIFTRFPPADPPTKRKYECPKCNSDVKDWMTACNNCGEKFHPCILTGRSILQTKDIVQCKVCRHYALEQEIRTTIFCPLCHHTNLAPNK